MSLTFGDNISYQGKKPLDTRFLFSTLAAMKNYSENYLPSLAFCQNEEDGKFYTYSVNNSIDTVTGKWRELNSKIDSIGDINNVNISSPNNNEVLTYDSKTSKWINKGLSVEGVSQYTEMPAASASYLNKVVQFIGNSNDNFKSGQYYKCIMTQDSYRVWNSVAWYYSVTNAYRWTKNRYPSAGQTLYMDKACTTVEKNYNLVEYDADKDSIHVIYPSIDNRWQVFDLANSDYTDYPKKYGWQAVTLNDNVKSDSMTYSSNKVEELIDNLSIDIEANKVDKKEIWTGTRTEYNANKADIPDGSLVNITDDDDNALYIGDADILDSLSDIKSNTENNKIAGALAVKELANSQKTYSLSLGATVRGTGSSFTNTTGKVIMVTTAFRTAGAGYGRITVGSANTYFWQCSNVIRINMSFLMSPNESFSATVENGTINDWAFNYRTISI